MENLLLKLLLSFLVWFECCAGFQPLPDMIDTWSKRGATKLDYQKTVLECGFGNPYDSGGVFGHELKFGDVEYDNTEYDNARALAEQCMQLDGWVHRSSGTVCEQSPNLPACQPGVEIPKRDVNRRLKGSYCKFRTNYALCLEKAKFPENCKKEPDPACLP